MGVGISEPERIVSSVLILMHILVIFKLFSTVYFVNCKNYLQLIQVGISGHAVLYKYNTFDASCVSGFL